MRSMTIVILVLILISDTEGHSAQGTRDGKEEDQAVQKWSCAHTSTHYEEKCGDICAHWVGKCSCGSDTFNVYNDGKQCCVNTSQTLTNTSQCSKDGWDGRCDSGTPFAMSVPCDGVCYNDYSLTSPLGYKARYKCGSGDCVSAYKMCRGYSLCSDKNDIQECAHDLKCVYTGAGGHTVEKLPGGHRYCHYHDYDNDGTYDTIGRTDEENSVSKQESNVDYNSLVPCRYNNDTGLKCGQEECVPNNWWCRDEWAYTCTSTTGPGNRTTSFSSNDAKLCGNSTFWTRPEHDCNDYVSNVDGVAGYGQRCTGTRQQCYWPWYSWYNAQEATYAKSSCDDYSDQIFLTESTCNTKKYTEMYLSFFCSNASGTECSTIQMLIKKANETQNMKTLDPHNCRASCMTPGPDCKACTNPEYKICTRNNTEVCLHPQLVCDGHQHCDGGEDERGCLDTYAERGIIEQYATYICPNAMYPDILTVATACNNIVECHLGTDEEEDRCEGKEATGLIVTSIFVLGIYFSLKIWGKLFKQVKCRRRRRRASFNSIAKIDPEELLKEYEEKHDDPYVLQKINVYFLHLHLIKTKKWREDNTIKLYNLERRIHKTKPEIYSCLKHRTSDDVSKMVIDDKFPRCFDRYCSCIKVAFEKLDYFRKIITLAKKIVGILSHYCDVFTDVFLMITMFIAVGGLAGVRSFPDRFTSVVILSSGVTIVFPLLISSLHLAINNPGLIFNRGFQTSPRWLNIVMGAGVMVTSFLNPIILSVMFQTIKEKMRRETKYARSLKVLYLHEKYRAVKKQHAVFLWIEMGLETYYQAAGQILLLLLSKSRTPTTGGFETMFKKESFFLISADTFLIISVIMSLRSCIFKKVKALLTDMTNLSFTAKIIVFLWFTAATLRRILAMVTCFVPSMGLLHTLHHWRAEQIPFWIRKDRAAKSLMKSNDTLSLLNMTEKVFWSDIDRWNYTTPKSPQAPHYTHYTGLSLGDTFIGFLCLVALHFICITVIKFFTVENTKKHNYYNVFVHILQNLNLPLPLEDWSQGTWSVAEYRKRLRRQNLEMGLCFSVNLVMTVVQMVPLWWTGNEINLLREAFIKKNHFLIDIRQ